jgi:hypothetical protein
MVMLFCGAVLFFALRKRLPLNRLPLAGLLIARLALSFVEAVLSAVENLFWTDLLNGLEHFICMITAAMLAVWCWRVLRMNRGSNESASQRI